MGIVLILLVLRTFTDLDEEPPTYEPPEEVELILTVGTKGGLCATEDGMGEICESVDKIYSNGVLVGEHDHTYSKAQIAEARRHIAVLESLDYSKVQLTDCGSSTFDGQDFYMLLPKAGVEVEACHVLPTKEGEQAYNDLMALLATGVNS